MSCFCGPNKENVSPEETRILYATVLGALRDSSTENTLEVFAGAVTLALHEPHNESFLRMYCSVVQRMRAANGVNPSDTQVNNVLFNNGFRAFLNLLEGDDDDIHLIRDPTL